MVTYIYVRCNVNEICQQHRSALDTLLMLEDLAFLFAVETSLNRQQIFYPLILPCLQPRDEIQTSSSPCIQTCLLAGKAKTGQALLPLITNALIPYNT